VKLDKFNPVSYSTYLTNSLKPPLAVPVSKLVKISCALFNFASASVNCAVNLATS
jgi:hypothetical protein